jgi:DNA polymerase-3 subunit epsilon
MLFFYDTETSTLVNKNLPPDHPDQAHLVELGAILCDEDGTERSSVSLIVRPQSWQISPGAAAVHGITQEIAERSGVDVGFAIQTFCHFLDLSTKALAFNMAFDKNVISLELIRMGESRPVEWPPEVELECIMERAKAALNLPPTAKMKRAGRFESKTPNLGEAYMKLFDEELIGAHSALADARAAKRVWFKLKGMGEPGRNNTWKPNRGTA